MDGVTLKGAHPPEIKNKFVHTSLQEWDAQFKLVNDKDPDKATKRVTRALQERTDDVVAPHDLHPDCYGLQDFHVQKTSIKRDLECNHVFDVRGHPVIVGDVMLGLHWLASAFQWVFRVKREVLIKSQDYDYQDAGTMSNPVPTVPASKWEQILDEGSWHDSRLLQHNCYVAVGYLRIVPGPSKSQTTTPDLFFLVMKQVHPAANAMCPKYDKNCHVVFVPRQVQGQSMLLASDLPSSHAIQNFVAFNQEHSRWRQVCLYCAFHMSPEICIVSSLNEVMSLYCDLISTVACFMSPLNDIMSRNRHLMSPVSISMSPNIKIMSLYCLLISPLSLLHVQVNGVPVNPSGGGDVTRRLCMGQPHLIKAIEAMESGSTMIAAALRQKLQVQLVPCRQHILLLGSVQYEYTHKQVFLGRSDDRSNGPFMLTIPKAQPGELQIFLLRAFAMTGNAESEDSEPDLGFLVKVFSTKTDSSCNSGLKLALVYARDLVKGKATTQEYVEDGSSEDDPQRGPRIVLPQHMAVSTAPSPVVGTGPPQQRRPQEGAAQSVPKQTNTAVSPAASLALGPGKQQPRRPNEAAGNRGGKQPIHNLRPLASPGSEAPDEDEEMLVWCEHPMGGGGSQPKKTKIACFEDLVPRFGFDTCESLVPASVAKSHRHLSPAEYGLNVVMKGHAAVPPPTVVGHELRKDRAAVWTAVAEFWSSVAMQSVAGVMALALDGYGHGLMNVLTKLAYRGCCGRWDMFAVVAARHLALFPPKYVSAASKCPTSPFMSAMMYFIST